MELFLLYGYEFLCVFLPFLAAFFLFRQIQRRTGKNLSKAIYAVSFLFASYLFGVYMVTGAGTLFDGLLRHWEIRPDRIHLIPFSDGFDLFSDSLNLLLFLPFGFLVPLLWKQMNRFIYTTAAGFSFSLLIELSQLLNNRYTDINDLIINTLGTMLGFLLYRLWHRHTTGTDRADGLAWIELPVYLVVTFTGHFLLCYELGFAGLLYGF